MLSIGLVLWLSMLRLQDDLANLIVDVRGRHPRDRTNCGCSCIPEQKRPRDIVAVVPALLLGLGRRHAMAGVVKHQTGQEMAEGGPGSGLMTPLVREHRLDAIEQVAIEDRGLLARIDLPLVVDLANVEAIAQQME